MRKIHKHFWSYSSKIRYSMVIPETFQSHSRVIPDSFWSHSGGHFGVILVIPESFWSHSGVILESFRSHSGVFPESFRRSFWSHSSHSIIIQQSFHHLSHSRVIPATFQESFQSFQSHSIVIPVILESFRSHYTFCQWLQNLQLILAPRVLLVL